MDAPDDAPDANEAAAWDSAMTGFRVVAAAGFGADVPPSQDELRARKARRHAGAAAWRALTFALVLSPLRRRGSSCSS